MPGSTRKQKAVKPKLPTDMVILAVVVAFAYFSYPPVSCVLLSPLLLWVGLAKRVKGSDALNLAALVLGIFGLTTLVAWLVAIAAFQGS